jgi:hypothetical protein
LEIQTEPVHAEIIPDEITFTNGRKARLVIARPGVPTSDLLSKLGLKDVEAVICLSGSADSLADEVKPHLLQLFSRGIVRAAFDNNALILDGGTQSGVMDLMGEALADRDHQAVLLGVAPFDLARYPGKPETNVAESSAQLDPNHTHFLLTEGHEWGDETRRMFEVADHLTSHSGGVASGKKIPSTMILAGGNLKGIARKEVLQAVRRGWPVIVIEESGELADRIAFYLRNPDETIKEPEISEIVEEGNLFLYPLKGPARGFKELITRQFGEVEFLRQAWERFGVYDAQAERYKKDYYRMQTSILALGVITTLLIIISTLYREQLASQGGISAIFAESLIYLVIILPITTSALLAFVSRLNPGNKWVLLRSSAEAIKRAIYLYRTRPVTYPKTTLGMDGQEPPSRITLEEEKQEQATREAELNSRIQFITSQLMQSDVNMAALPPYGADKRIPPENTVHPDDNGLSPLTPENYIKQRLNDQVTWYKKKTVQKERYLRLYQAVILAIGGLGTFLAAIRQELWVALTTSIATALATFLQTHQVENTLVQYNQTATNLENVRSWWLSLQPEEQARRENVERLVRTTEMILETETIGWMQQMQDVLAGLREEQEAEEREREFKISAAILGSIQSRSFAMAEEITIESSHALAEEDPSLGPDITTLISEAAEAEEDSSEEHT